MKQRGFTFIEIIVITGIMATLFGLVTVSVAGTQRRATLATTVDTLLTDLASQQTKAMVGDTQGGTTPSDYGIRFETGRLLLFAGTTYNSSDPANAEVIVGTGMALINVTLPNNSIVFTKGSGEVNGFAAGSNGFTVLDVITGDRKVIEVNRYGVVTSVN